MITEINEENRQDIINITRSVLVCLDLLLKEHHIIHKLNKFAPSCKHICSNREMLDHIFDILNDDEFAAFRLHINRMLANSCLFRERLELAQDLSPKKQFEVKTKELMAAIKDCDQNFMKQFCDLINTLDCDTINSCFDLLTFINGCEPSLSHTHNTYCGPRHSSSEVIFSDDCSEHHSEHESDHEHSSEHSEPDREDKRRCGYAFFSNLANKCSIQ